MNLRTYALAVIGSVALLAGGVGKAAATTSACSANMISVNGGNSIAGATEIGTVGPGCLEIGLFSKDGGSRGNNDAYAFVDGDNNPSIYMFTWGGGLLTIQEELGNNGSGHNIDVELGLALGNSLTGNKGLTSHVASVSFLLDPDHSGPTLPIYIIQNFDLPAGTYLLDTYLGAPCSTSGGCGEDAGGDPKYEVLFTPGVGAVPLPGSLALLGSALGGFGGLLGLRRRRRRMA